MTRFSNLLLIYRLMYQILCVQADTDDLRKTYTHDKLMNDVVSLKKTLEHHVNIQYYHIMKQLLTSNIKAALPETEVNNDLSTFFSKCLEILRIVYRTERYDLYFSNRQENNTDPIGGLPVFVLNDHINSVEYFLNRIKNVYLTIHIFDPLKSLSSPFYDTVDFHFVRSLCIHCCNSEIVEKSGFLKKGIYNSIFDNFKNLETLKLVNMVVDDNFNEELSNNTHLRNLDLINCYFYNTKDVRKQRTSMYMIFNESYESICISMCGKDAAKDEFQVKHPSYYRYVYTDVTKSENLRKLNLYSPGYVCKIFSMKGLCHLKELLLCIMNDELLSVSNLCPLAQLEYLSIFIGEGNKTIDSTDRFLGIINRSKLKHLVITYSIAEWYHNRKVDMSNIFSLEFNTLEILEIKACGYRLTLSRFENELSIKKIRSLKIHCWVITSEFVRAMNKMESLTDLSIMLPFKCGKIYNYFLNQFSLKESLVSLYINFTVDTRQLLRSLKAMKNLKVVGINNVLESRQTRNIPYKVRNIFRELFVRSLDFFHSRFLTCPQVTTLHLSGTFWCDSHPYMLLNMWEVFINFANIEELIIECDESEPSQKDLTEEENSAHLNHMVTCINHTISVIFKKFRHLRVLIIDCKNNKFYQKLIDSLSKNRTEEFEMSLQHYKWSAKYNCERITWEIRKEKQFK